MTEKELKKLVAAQEQAMKMRAQVEDLVRLHNALVPEIQRLANDVAFGTNYEIDGIPYVRDERIFSIAVEEQPFHRTAIGLKALRRAKREEPQPEPVAEEPAAPTPPKRTRRATTANKAD
jgi:hypothetical protein